MLAPMLPSFLLTVLVVELTPGPNMAWLALLSAREGRRAGLAATLGIALGLAILAVAAALGMATLLEQSPALFAALRFAGAAFLLYLAWDTWRGHEEISQIYPQDGNSSWASRHFGYGLLINLLNPKAALLFAVVVPAHVSIATPIMPQTLLLSAVYVLVATAVHLVLVMLASQAHGLLQNAAVQRRLRGVFAVLILAVAIWFLFRSG